MLRKFHSTKMAMSDISGRDISANDISGGQSRWLLTEKANFALLSFVLMSFAQMLRKFHSIKMAMSDISGKGH
jgi:hypothetical protein